MQALHQCDNNRWISELPEEPKRSTGPCAEGTKHTGRLRLHLALDVTASSFPPCLLCPHHPGLLVARDAIQPSHPLSSPSPPAFNHFQHQGLFQWVRWPKYWSFSISPSKEYSGLISCRIDWFDLLAVQATLKSLLQHDNLKASVLRHSAFFMVQLSHPYMTIGKTIALTIQTFVDKMMSLLFHTLSRFVIVILPRCKHLLILWLQSPSVLIL